VGGPYLVVLIRANVGGRRQVEHGAVEERPLRVDDGADRQQLSAPCSGALHLSRMLCAESNPLHHHCQDPVGKVTRPVEQVDGRVRIVRRR